MVSKIEKRDGRIQPFCKMKIVDAILKAMDKTGELDRECAMKIADEISSTEKDVLSVEQVQDMVEMKLMESPYRKTAKEYITYRDMRNRQREKNSDINRQIASVIMGSDIKNSNANVDEMSFSGKKFESANILHRNISLDVFCPPDVAAAHRESRLYLHDLCDLDIGEHNCLFVDVAHLLNNGFSTRNGDVRPANSFSTACQLVAVIFQCQSQVRQMCLA